jgi:hypothetical protein
MGTLYLGADAGAGGKIVFDYSKTLNVSSLHPRPAHRISCF